MQKRNIKAPSLTHCCGGKAASIRYSECVYVALPAWKAHASYCLWPVRPYNIFPRYHMNYKIFKNISWTTQFHEKINEHKKILIFSSTFIGDIPQS